MRHNERYNVDGTYGLLDALLRSLEPHIVKDIAGKKSALPDIKSEASAAPFDLETVEMPPYLQQVSREERTV